MSGSSEPVTLWVDATGDDIFDLVRGVSYNKGDARSEAQAGYIPILRANNIAEGQINPDDLVYVPSRYVSPEQFLRTGDVLIAASSGSRSVVGKAAQASTDHTQFAFGAFCAVARPKTPEFGDWIALFTRTRQYREYVESVALGININNFRGSDFKAMTVPLAPSNEQRRIVSKFNSLSGKSKRARDHLDHVPRLVEKYKEAVFAAAFRGKLTQDWRALNDVNEAWRSVRIGEIAQIASGQTPKGIEALAGRSGSLPWYKVSSMNAKGNEHTLSSSEFMLRQEDFETLRLRLFPTGTIVFPKRGGAIATNKKRKIGKPGALDLNLMALVPKQVDPEYLWWWVQTLDLAKLSNGSNVPQINNGDIEPLVVPLPSPAEQSEIVRRLQAMVAWIDRLASEATSARKLIDHLDHAILSKAFRGELVPQDPDDEPASVLLERIAAERAGSAPKGRRGRTRSAA